jgi:hypothetical protein
MIKKSQLRRSIITFCVLTLLSVVARRPDRLWGPPNLISNGYRGPSGVKRPGRGADHSPPASAEAKKM